MSQSRISYLWVFAEWAALGAALALFTLLENYHRFIWVGLGLLVLSVIFRKQHAGRWVPNTGLEVPAILLVGSAALSTWIAYDQRTALLQFSRLLAGVVLYYALCASPLSIRNWVAAAFVLAAAALAVYWPLQYDYAAAPVKFPLLISIGKWLNTNIPPPDLVRFTGPTIHPNVAAGTLTLAVPFAFALAWDNWTRKRRWLGALFIFAALVIVAGVIMTTSRGAWLALAASGGVLILAFIQRRWFVSRVQKEAFWSLFLLLVISSTALIVAAGGLDRLAEIAPDPNGSLQTRLDLWRQSTNIIRDYFFTGSGLRSYYLLYAIYYRLIHVPYIHHTHNTFLEVWIEQGVLGALALLWISLIVLNWAWRALKEAHIPPLGWAGFAALMLIFLQGQVDVVFYMQRPLPLVGMALACAWMAVEHIPQSSPTLASRAAARQARLAGFAVLILAVVGVLVYHRPFLAAWYANAGAVAQASLELNRYVPSRFAELSLDQVRRSVDLRLVEESFRQALTWDSSNITARQRLTQIALSRAQYPEALDLIQPVWQNGGRDILTRMLYADALAANDQVEQAAQVIRGFPLAEQHLIGLPYYRFLADGDYARAVAACQTVLLVQPGNQQARSRLKDAEKRLLAP